MRKPVIIDAIEADIVRLGGRKVAASVLGIACSTVHAELEEWNERQFNISEVMRLIQAAAEKNAYLAIQRLCEHAGGCFVPAPQRSTFFGNVEALAQFLKEIGEAIGRVNYDIAKDGKFNSIGALKEVREARDALMSIISAYRRELKIEESTR